MSNYASLKATINAKKQLVVTTPDKYWNGSEKIRLDVTDPEGARASQQIDFDVTPVNDPPVITKEIGNQKIKEKERFSNMIPPGHTRSSRYLHPSLTISQQMIRTWR